MKENLDVLADRLAEMREEIITTTTTSPVKRTKSQNEQSNAVDRKRSTKQRKNDENSASKNSNKENINARLSSEKLELKRENQSVAAETTLSKRSSTHLRSSFVNTSQEREPCAHCQDLNKQHFDALMKDLYRFLIIG